MGWAVIMCVLMMRKLSEVAVVAQGFNESVIGQGSSEIELLIGGRKS